MRFAFFSTEGFGFAWWMRLLGEGHDVRVFIKEKDARSVGEGFVERADSEDGLLRWASQDDNTIYVFEMTGFGDLADRLRSRHKKVVGSSVLGDKLEDRSYGQRVASLAGIRVPKSERFGTITDALDFVRKLAPAAKWYFKAEKKGLASNFTYGGHDRDDLRYMMEYFKQCAGDIPCLLQQKVEGLVTDISWWWTGSRIVGYIGTIEYKAAYTGDLGPGTMSATTLSWKFAEAEPKLAKQLKLQDVAELFKRLHIPAGPYDINCVISEANRQPYFLEWGPRFGWDSDTVFLQGLTRPWGEALAALAAGTISEMPFVPSEYMGGLHVAVQPYPYTNYPDVKHSAYRVPVRGLPDLVGDRFSPYGLMIEDGHLKVASPYGNVGVALGKGSSVKEVTTDIYKVCKELQIPDAWWRTDFGKHEADDLQTLKRLGYDAA